MDVLNWLLDSDPAIRWQVLRDLVHAPAEVAAAERARIAIEGWGARLLALQGDDGQWAGGACFPGRYFDQHDEHPGQPWTSMLPTLQLLHDFGIDPSADRPRLDEAIAVLRSRQQPDGTWLLENTHPGADHFALEDGDGRPSRWNTLRALRVLDWHAQSRR